MHSIRTKTTLLTVIAIIVAMAAATTLGVMAVRNIGNNSSDQILLLLCETGEKNLDSYFDSVEQSVETVSSFAQGDLKDLKNLEDEEFSEHMDRVSEIFAEAVSTTSGVLTYYYRIDPAVSDTVKGFWYTNLDGKGFEEHEVTDITKYDTSDTSRLVWFTVPKFTGEAIWLPPYITDNLDVRVISYNVPIYYRDEFVGVIGIELDYSTMAEQVDNLKLYQNGYAFINDAEGNIIYHPYIDVAQMEQQPKVPEGLLSDDTFIRYNYEGVEKMAVWLPLDNGMRLNVTVPVSEINGDWMRLIYKILAVSVILLLVFIFITMRFTGRITRPLRELTRAAEQMDEGNYEFELKSDADDEVGILTRTFGRLVGHLKVYIDELNNLAYADALTSVHNKGAYDIYIRDMQQKLDEAGGDMEFGIGMFDCDDLKMINDDYGHEKGDVYLKAASNLICTIFKRSPVFRIGGDEFVVILQNDDFRNRAELIKLFRDTGTEICALADEPWEEVHVAMGIAVYDPACDRSVNDVAIRADQLMYDNKRNHKEGQQAGAQKL